jgi:glycosyltransferase involved in cell wall biosynthesis
MPTTTVPRVSVVVPTYNRAYCLRATLESALAQTITDLEVIVIDDGSTDHTPALVAETQRTDARIRFARQENLGVSAARNAGFALSRGEYVALLDSDDLWAPWKLELQLACMERFPELGMTWTDFSAMSPESVELYERYIRRMYSAWSLFELEEVFHASHPIESVVLQPPARAKGAFLWTGDIYSSMIMGSLVHTSTVVLRRSRLAQVGEFDETLRPAGEDYDFHLRTCREGPVGFLDLPTTRYRIGMPDALTRQDLALARHFLATVTREIDQHRDRIRLSDRDLRWVLGDANRWIGEAFLEQGDVHSARRYLKASRRHDRWHAKTLKLSMLSMIPSAQRERLRSWYRCAAQLFVARERRTAVGSSA